MASLIGSLYVSLTADYSAFNRNMRAAGGVVQTTSSGMRRDIGLTSKSVSGFQRSMSSGVRPFALISAARAFDTVNQRANLLRGALFATTAAFGGLGAAITSNVVSRYLDTFTGLENQIRVVSEGSANLAAQIRLVGRVAEDTRGSLGATATLYSRIAKARPEDGAVATLRRVETINKALQLGGATAQESSSAAIQLSQAIASNRLGGEELRAILETPLGLELAKGLGVTIGKFREMGYAGELTADVVLGSLDKIAAGIDQKFGKSVQTIDQSLTVLDGKITLFAGNLDKAYGITRLISGAIIGFGNNLETIIPTLITVGALLGSAFAGRFIGRAGEARYLAVKKEIAARKELLAAAKDNYKEARRAAAEANRNVAAASVVPAAGVKSLAGPGMSKELQRQMAALDKLEKQRQKNTEKQSLLRERLGAVEVKTTTQAIKAAENLVKAEQRLKAELQQRNNLYKQRQTIDRNISKLQAEQQIARRAEAATVSLRKEFAARDDLNKKLERSSAGVLKSREMLAERTVALTRLETAAERKATQERVALRQKLQNLKVEAGAIRSNMGLQRDRVGGTNTAMEAAGRAALAANARAAAATAAALAANVAATQTAMQKAARATGVLATSWGLLKNAGGSLLGLLGGPWGAILTAATVAIAIFGAKAAESAADISRARQVISEELDRLGKTSIGESVDVQAALISDEILAQTDRLRDVQKRVEGLRDTFLNGVSERVIPQFANDDAALARVSVGLENIKKGLQEGSILFSEVYEKLRQLGVSSDVLDDLRKEFKDTVVEGNSAVLVIRELDRQITALDGKRAQLTVDVKIVGENILDFSSERSLNERIFGKNPPPLELPSSAPESYRSLQAQKIAEEELARAKDDTAQSIRDKTKALYEEHDGALTLAQAGALATEIQAVDDAKKAEKAGRGAAKEFENFNNKIKELKETAEGSFLSDLDRQVLDFADGLKDGSEMMRKYIEAIKSGDLSSAPAQLLQVRDALLKIGAGELWEGIIENYGNGADLTKRFAEEQAKLQIAVASGAITASMAEQYWNDFITGFKEYEWIDSAAGAITDFAKAAITDFKNIGDAFKNLVNRLLEIALQMLVLDPFKNWLKGILGGIAGVPSNVIGAAAPAIGQALAPAFSGSPSRMVGMPTPTLAFDNVGAGMPRGRMSTMMEQADSVMRNSGTSVSTKALDGLAGKINTSGSVSSDNRVFNIDARGAQKGVGEEIRSALKAYDKGNTARVAAGFSRARQRRLIK